MHYTAYDERGLLSNVSVLVSFVKDAS